MQGAVDKTGADGGGEVEGCGVGGGGGEEERRWQEAGGEGAC